MPRFTIKDMLIATTLIAVGVGMIASLLRNTYFSNNGGAAAILVMMLLWYGGGACIGAGLFMPFGSPRTGAGLALMIQVVLSGIPFFVH